VEAGIEQNRASSDRAEGTRDKPSVEAMLRRRNRTLAAMLASFVVAMLVTVVSLAVMLHYAQAHHVLVAL
jgi:hypothetical protein